MKDTLEQILKEEMGYTFLPCPACKCCIHSLEKENLHVDRDWYYVCKFNNIGEMSVNENGRCKYFEGK